MADQSILVAGSLHFDIVIEAPHLPAADETVKGGPVRFVCGGKGGNQAVAAARHGASVAMLGRIGVDWFGNQLQSNLVAAGIDISMLQRDDVNASGMSVAIVDRQAEYGAVIASGANDQLKYHAVEFPRNIGLLLLQNEIPESANIYVARKLRGAGAIVILNAAPMREMDQSFLAEIDILVVNRFEACAFFGNADSDPETLTSCLENRAAGPAMMLATLGSQGVLSHRLGEQVVHHTPFAVEAKSTHGAGDHFVGALSACLVSGRNFACSVEYAQAAAAHFVESGIAAKLPDFERIAKLIAGREVDSCC